MSIIALSEPLTFDLADKAFSIDFYIKPEQLNALFFIINDQTVINIKIKVDKEKERKI